jgi:hypothetical protein
MGDRFLEQRINFTFCVKLGKNANDTCAVLSEAYGRDAMKKSSIFERHKRFKEGSHVEITNEENAHHFLLSLNSFHKASQSTKLMWKYWSSYMKLYVERGLKFGPTIGFSTMTLLQLTRRCQVFSGPKNDYWNGTPILFLWFDSEWLLTASKNEVCLKETKISGYWRQPNNCNDAPKAIP